MHARSLLVVWLLAGCGGGDASSSAPRDSGVGPVDSSRDVDADVASDAGGSNGTRPALVWAKPVSIGAPAALGVAASGNLLVGELPASPHTDSQIDAFDSDGAALWSAAAKGPRYAFDSAGDGIGGGLDQTGSSSWSLNVARLDAAGKVRFSKAYGNEVGIHFFDVALDEVGNGYFSGDFTKPLDFGAGPVTSTGDEVFVIEVDADGKPLWMKQLPGVRSAVPLAADATGLLVGGTASGQDFGDGAIDGMFVVSLGAADHALRWAVRGGTTGYVIEVIADGSGGGALVLTGKGAASWDGHAFDALGDHDFTIVRFDAKGATSWLRRIAVPSVVWNVSLAISTTSGDLALSLFTSTGSADLGEGALVGDRNQSSAFLGRYDGSGAPRWTARYGEGGTVSMNGIGFAKDDTIVVAGYTDSSLDLGGTIITPAKAGSRQSFLARLSK